MQEGKVACQQTWASQTAGEVTSKQIGRLPSYTGMLLSTTCIGCNNCMYSINVDVHKILKGSLKKQALNGSLEQTAEAGVFEPGKGALSCGVGFSPACKHP